MDAVRPDRENGAPAERHGAKGLNVRIHPDAAAAERDVADAVIGLLGTQPKTALGLATGRSMVGVYRRLVASHAEHSVTFAGVTTFNLDEYEGLPADHSATFASYMRRHFFDHVDVAQAARHFPYPDQEDAFERAIAAAGGIDLQLLGLGRNGHIGFNEPGSPRDSRTRRVHLSPSTRQANAGDFGADLAPSTAVTMGVGTILEARRIVLLATGSAKAEALAAALDGPIGPDVPASFLRTSGEVTLVCDAAAAAGVPQRWTPSP